LRLQTMSFGGSNIVNIERETLAGGLARLAPDGVDVVMTPLGASDGSGGRRARPRWPCRCVGLRRGNGDNHAGYRSGLEASSFPSQLSSSSSGDLVDPVGIARHVGHTFKVRLSRGFSYPAPRGIWADVRVVEVTPGVPHAKPSRDLDRGSGVIARTSAGLGRIGHYLGFRPVSASHDYHEDAFSPR
jgi:hypothetical protein